MSRHAAQAHLLEKRAHPLPADPVASRQPAEVISRRAPSIDRTGVEKRTNLAQRASDAPVGPPVDQDGTSRRLRQSEGETQRRGLARSVWAEEPRHEPGAHRDREVVDGQRRTVALGQATHLEHAAMFAEANPRAHRSS